MSVLRKTIWNVRKRTCYENFENRTCIDLMLTNLQSTYVIETGLSGFYLLTLTDMRKKYRNFQPRIISYK